MLTALGSNPLAVDGKATHHALLAFDVVNFGSSFLYDNLFRLLIPFLLHSYTRMGGGMSACRPSIYRAKRHGTNDVTRSAYACCFTCHVNATSQTRSAAVSSKRYGIKF